MAVIEYDEYKQKLLALEPTLGELEKALGIPKARVMQALEAAGLSPMARPEQLTLEDFCALQKALND